MSILKALTYALNEPSKELLYMPTSDAIKFKAKAWIDVFGARSMKALGSFITHSARDNPKLLVRYGTAPTMFISLVLFAISMAVGRRFDELIVSGEVVGSESGEEEGEVAEPCVRETRAVHVVDSSPVELAVTATGL